MDTKPELRYGPLGVFLEAKLVILGLIDFLFGLPINLIVNQGKLNLKSISQKMWQK